MDKRSFNLLFTVVAVSMVLIGTYRISKKKPHQEGPHSSATAKINK